MTIEMIRLLEKLHTVEVRNINSAYDYIGNEINRIDMDGKLTFVMEPVALKKINKDVKLLKKFFKGKVEMNPDTVFEKYEENTQEHFFLMCLVRLMQYNGK